MRTYARKQQRSQQPKSDGFGRPGTAATPERRASPLLHLQRTIGNQAVLRLPRQSSRSVEPEPDRRRRAGFSHDFSRIPAYSRSPVKIQLKLTVNSPTDVYEQEADRVADQVMRMPETWPVCFAGEACTKSANSQGGQGQLQIRGVRMNDADGVAVPPIARDVTRSPGAGGRPLSDSVRSYFEPRFGYDFGQVRVHTDARAVRLCRTFRAQAFTYGNDIYFGERPFTPGSAEGKHLLAHELAHTIQQCAPSGVAESRIQRREVCDEEGICWSEVDPVGVISLVPPGDCTAVEHRTLQDAVNRACKRRRRCAENDSCATIWERIQANAECIKARSTINAKCFRGGDVGHTAAVMAAVGALNRCWAVYNRKCRTKAPPVPVPVPVPAPEKKPVVDKGFMDRMAKITGLTGAALVIYIIISEGSRILFPPRNLVPVP